MKTSTPVLRAILPTLPPVSPGCSHPLSLTATTVSPLLSHISLLRGVLASPAAPSSMSILHCASRKTLKCNREHASSTRTLQRLPDTWNSLCTSDTVLPDPASPGFPSSATPALWLFPEHPALLRPLDLCTWFSCSVFHSSFRYPRVSFIWDLLRPLSSESPFLTFLLEIASTTLQPFPCHYLTCIPVYSYADLLFIICFLLVDSTRAGLYLFLLYPQH